MYIVAISKHFIMYAVITISASFTLVAILSIVVILTVAILIYHIRKTQKEIRQE